MDGDVERKTMRVSSLVLCALCAVDASRQRPFSGSRLAKPAQPLTPARTSRPEGPAPTSAGVQAVDAPLLARLVGTQMLVGYTIFTGGIGAQVLHAHAHLDSASVWLIGGLGALPLLALGRVIETSPSSALVEINASTNRLALRMFGPRAQPILALSLSAALGALVGVVEETLFRGQLLPSLSAYATTHGLEHDEAKLAAVAASALVFALAHINVLGGLKQIASKETGVTVALQLATGAWFGALSIATGQLGTAIVAHGVYDACTLYGTHLRVTRQVSRATARGLAALRLPALAGWLAARGASWTENASRLFFLLDGDGDGEVSAAEARSGGITFGLCDETIAALEARAANGGLQLGAFFDAVADLSNAGAKARAHACGGE